MFYYFDFLTRHAEFNILFNVFVNIKLSIQKDFFFVKLKILS